ncbi:MAG: HAD hydrolase family protein [Bacillota bacterium]|nr:HAD hydrolase family protein [Bacillota bacterium]
MVCFGDAINDIADAAYTVENANTELKKFSKGVIASNNEDGVAMWFGLYEIEK